MLASVTIDFVAKPAAPSLKSSDDKIEFWSRFDRYQRGQTDAAVSSEVGATEAAAFEQQFRAKFPQTLERLVNAASPLPTAETSAEAAAAKAPDASAPKVRPRTTIKLIALEYGSIKAIIEILSNETVQEVLLTVLEAYSPWAFNEALGSNVAVAAHAEYLGGGPPANPGNPELQVGWPRKVLRAALATTSLLIPVAIALALFVGAVWAILHEMDALHEEAAKLGTERIAIVNALVDQNKGVSASLVANSTAVAASTKALTDLLTAAGQKVVDRAMAPTDSTALTTSIEKVKADTAKIGSDVEKLSTRLATLEGRPPPTGQVPSNCQPGLASNDCALIQLALFRKVGKPADPRRPQQAWNDGVGGPATLEAIRLYLTSIRAPQADYLSPAQIKELISQSN